MGIFKFVFLLFLQFKLFSDEFYIISVAQHPQIGFFATLNQVLGQLYLYEKGRSKFSGLAVDFGEHGLYYDPKYGPNWWSYYFEPLSIGIKENSVIKIASKKEAARGFIERYQITRMEAASLVKKYIHVKDQIQDKVNQFVIRHFQNFFTIGVHYRGTDKKKEAPRVSYENVFKSIKDSSPLDRPYQIFVATDEAPFLEAIKEKFPGRVISIEAHRTEGNSGVHFLNNSPYELGEEALLDALLLSKCNLLIRTSSNLSLWSTYFNSELPVILLNRRYAKTLEPE